MIIKRINTPDTSAPAMTVGDLMMMLSDYDPTTPLILSAGQVILEHEDDGEIVAVPLEHRLSRLDITDILEQDDSHTILLSADFTFDISKMDDEPHFQIMEALSDIPNDCATRFELDEKINEATFDLMCAIGSTVEALDYNFSAEPLSEIGYVAYYRQKGRKGLVMTLTPEGIHAADRIAKENGWVVPAELFCSIPADEVSDA